jgi:hypothetical protein
VSGPPSDALLAQRAGILCPWRSMCKGAISVHQYWFRGGQWILGTLRCYGRTIWAGVSGA